MNRIEIPISKMLTYKALKPGIVHQKGKLTYKYAKNSQEIMTFLEYIQKTENIPNILYAKAFLYQNNQYYGYASLYYKKLKDVSELIKSPSFNKNIFVEKLIELIKTLDNLCLCYYDLHFGNVKISEDEPFLLDTDHMIINPIIEDLIFQRRNLLCIIISIYTENFSIFAVNKMLSNSDSRKIFSNEAIKYLEAVIKRTEFIEEYPYIIIDELSDEEKTLKLKSFII